MNLNGSIARYPICSIELEPEQVLRFHIIVCSLGMNSLENNSASWGYCVCRFDYAVALNFLANCYVYDYLRVCLPYTKIILRLLPQGMLVNLVAAEKVSSSMGAG